MTPEAEAPDEAVQISGSRTGKVRERIIATMAQPSLVRLLRDDERNLALGAHVRL